MPTSHRAPRRSSGLLRILAITLAVLVVVAGATYVGIGLVSGSDDQSSGSGSAGPSVGAPASPTTPASPTHSTTTGSKKQRKQRKQQRAHTHRTKVTRVPASPPHAISIGRTVTSAPFGNALSPTSGRLIPDAVDELQRLGDRGIPGSPGTDTVVLVGASSTSGRGALDGIDSVNRGDSIVLETQDAKLTYRVTITKDVAASAVLSLPAVTARRTDRLVIDCAHYDSSQRTGEDRVLIATLVRAVPIRP